MNSTCIFLPLTVFLKAMEVLKQEIIRYQCPVQMSSDNVIDIEGNKFEESENELENKIVFSEEKIKLAVHEFYRSKYLYEEAENPDEFFLPYIWSNIVSYIYLSPFSVNLYFFHLGLLILLDSLFS
jgi:hypothetical protein